MSVAENIRKKLGTLPHKPGIYLMRDRFGTVIYVGKARDLRKRVSHVFPAVAAPGLGPEVQGADRGDSRFRLSRRAQRAGGAAAGEQADQGIPPALQRQFPRRQAVPDAQGQPERPDPALHADPPQTGRRGALFRAVPEFGRAAQHAGAGAPPVPSARLPAADARRTRLQALPLRASEVLHRAVHRQRDARAIPRAGGGRVRFPRGPMRGDAGAN